MESSLVTTCESSVSVHVTPHFNNGIHGLLLTLELLVNARSYDAKEISEMIRKAYRHFQHAHDQLSEISNLASVAYEKSVSDEHNLKQQIKKLELHIKESTIEIQEKNEEIEDTEGYLSDAKNQLVWAIQRENNARRDLSLKTYKRKSGWYAIPILGTIAAWSTGLDTDIENTRRHLRFSEDQVYNQERNIRRLNEELTSMRIKLQNLKWEKSSIEDKLRSQQMETAKLKQVQKDIDEYLYTIRTYLHYITVTLGKTKILHDESIEFLSPQPLLDIIVDIADYTRTSPQNLLSKKNDKLQEFLNLANHINTSSPFIYIFNALLFCLVASFCLTNLFISIVLWSRFQMRSHTIIHLLLCNSTIHCVIISIYFIVFFTVNLLSFVVYFMIIRVRVKSFL